MSHKFIGYIAVGAFSILGAHAAVRSGLFGKRTIKLHTKMSPFEPPKYVEFQWLQTYCFGARGTLLSISVENVKFFNRYEIQYKESGFARNAYINSVRPVDFYVDGQLINFTNGIWVNTNADSAN